MPMPVIAENLQGLKAKHGVFAVLGNHDGWFSDTSVAGELERVGFTVLQNEIAVIDRGGQKLRILGLRDHLKIRSWEAFDSEVRTVVANSEPAGDLLQEDTMHERIRVVLEANRGELAEVDHTGHIIALLVAVIAGSFRDRLRG